MSSKLFVKGKFTMQQFSFNLITIYTLCRMYTHSLIISVLHKLKKTVWLENVEYRICCVLQKCPTPFFTMELVGH